MKDKQLPFAPERENKKLTTASVEQNLSGRPWDDIALHPLALGAKYITILVAKEHSRSRDKVESSFNRVRSRKGNTLIFTSAHDAMRGHTIQVRAFGDGTSSASSSRLPSRDGFFTPKKRNSFSHQLIHNFFSVRNVLTIVMMILMAVCLATISILSHSFEKQIVAALNGDILLGKEEDINHSIDQIWRELDTVMNATNTFLLGEYLPVHVNLTTYDLQNGSLLDAFPRVYSFFLSQVERNIQGTTLEFYWDSGQTMGVEAINGYIDAYEYHLVNGTCFCRGHTIKAGMMIRDVVIPDPNLYYDFELPLSFYTSKYALSQPVCGYKWYTEFYLLFQEGAPNLFPVTRCQYFCNHEGVFVGMYCLSTERRPITLYLQGIIQETPGKLLITSSDGQIVSSSSGTNPFLILKQGVSYASVYAQNASEAWINQLAPFMHQAEAPASGHMIVDGVPYTYNVFSLESTTGLNWIVGQLLEKSKTDRLVANTLALQIGIDAAVICLSLILTFTFTFYITRPLRRLCFELSRVAHLELDMEILRVPLVEEGRVLHRAFVLMHAAISSFRRFVPAAVIVNILKTDKEVVPELKLRVATVVFQDIVDFTKMSEEIEVSSLAALTSEYMDAMTSIIHRHGGTIDKYIGDCIMSIYNAPSRVNNHEEAAVRAALECQKELERLNPSWRIRYGYTLHQRIGIHTGDMLVGTMGSIHRMNWTAIGDTVNVAARLEGVNKYYGTELLTSEAVATKLKGEEFLCRRIATVRVSGKQTQTSIFEVSKDKTKRELYASYERALGQFQRRQFSFAMESIAEALGIDGKDRPSQILRRRIEENQDSAEDSWSYVESIVK
ncbi:adenylate/guanylate cyclase with integral membrane sensor [Planoprotostelium fungivorum]|uniref:Adenylate/guanylate cyclase with integral membrane sensor n=1 Tax=Planoprotostelium fungivorum TaxID=1890364 RepID=A0A2P6NCB5_9EUKA|nr:adenylate/guanylate cyclase with integral membrane sensor [Planoprotostelium fungivorum]